MVDDYVRGGDWVVFFLLRTVVAFDVVFLVVNKHSFKMATFSESKLASRKAKLKRSKTRAKVDCLRFALPFSSHMISSLYTTTSSTRSGPDL